MKALIDTNVFVYASFAHYPQHPKALEFIKQCVGSSHSYCISYSIIYEYLRVVTHSGLFRNGALHFEQAIDNIERFLDHTNISIVGETDLHLTSLKKLSKKLLLQGNLVHDAHNVIMMQENDISVVYTADSDFNRFPEIKVINPLR